MSQNFLTALFANWTSTTEAIKLITLRLRAQCLAVELYASPGYIAVVSLRRRLTATSLLAAVQLSE